MFLRKFDNLHFWIDTNDREILLKFKDEFSEYVDGYMFNPKFKIGHWDGKIYLFDIYKKTLPFGLLGEFLAIKKKCFPNLKLEIDPEIKCFVEQDLYFENIEIEKLEPWDYRPYQEDCIRKALKYKKCILRAATSAGKSYIIAGIIKNLLHYKKIQNAIIIVPTTSLVEQFYKDLIDYGFYKEELGRVYSKFKDWDKKIVISTWQSLRHSIDNVIPFNCIIVDEVHTARATVIRDILKISSSFYRIGCTGTLPESRLDLLNVKSYLGPVVADVSASELGKLGFISDIQILQYRLFHNVKFSTDYNEAKNEIFQNPFRLNVIKNIINLSKKSILLLVGKVEIEGVFLKKYLLESLKCDDDHIVFISGSMSASDREIWRQKVINNPNEKFIIIATIQCFSTGVNIPNLSSLVFATPFKSKIPVLQSIGRILRKHHSKNGAIVYDIIDENNKWFSKYGDIRYRYYMKEKFKVTTKELHP